MNDDATPFISNHLPAPASAQASEVLDTLKHGLDEHRKFQSAASAQGGEKCCCIAHGTHCCPIHNDAARLSQPPAPSALEDAHAAIFKALYGNIEAQTQHKISSDIRAVLEAIFTAQAEELIRLKASLTDSEVVLDDYAERLSKTRAELEAQTLSITGFTRNWARELCGEVMRHKTTANEYPEIGVVECNKAWEAIETLISAKELAERNLTLATSKLDKAVAELELLREECRQAESRFCVCGPNTKSSECPYHRISLLRPIVKL